MNLNSDIFLPACAAVADVPPGAEALEDLGTLTNKIRKYTLLFQPPF